MVFRFQVSGLVLVEVWTVLMCFVGQPRMAHHEDRANTPKGFCAAMSLQQRCLLMEPGTWESSTSYEWYYYYGSRASCSYQVPP